MNERLRRRFSDQVDVKLCDFDESSEAVRWLTLIRASIESGDEVEELPALTALLGSCADPEAIRRDLCGELSARIDFILDSEQATSDENPPRKIVWDDGGWGFLNSTRSYLIVMSMNQQYVVKGFIAIFLPDEDARQHPAKLGTRLGTRQTQELAMDLCEEHANKT